MFFVNETAKTIAPVEELTSYFAAASISDPTTVAVAVADGCSAFRIGDTILRATGTSPKFAVDSSAAGWSGVSVDESFKVASNGQKMYYFSGSAFVEALTSVFYATNSIWLSDD